MTFRTTDKAEGSASGLTMSAVSEGQKYDGIVKKIEDYGLFVEIEGTKLRGLCHKSEVSRVHPGLTTSDVVVADFRQQRRGYLHGAAELQRRGPC